MNDNEFEKLLADWTSKARLSDAESAQMLAAIVQPAQEEPFTGNSGETWMAFWQTIGEVVGFGQRYGSWSIQQCGLFGARPIGG